MTKFQILDEIGQPAIVLSADFRVLYANQYAKSRFYSIAGIELKENACFQDLFTGSKYGSIGFFFIDLIQKLNENKIEQHTQRFTIDNSLSLQVCFKKNESEELGSYWVLTSVNITKQIFEDELTIKRYQEQVDVFKNLFDMAPVGLGIKDFEGGFYRVNQSLCEITEYTKDDLLALHPSIIFPDYNLERETELYNRILESESKSFRQERTLITSSGKKKIVSETINIVRDEYNHPFLIMVSYQDITEERELQRMLFESRKMEELGKLSGGIAHDFNNMLLPVTLCSDIALQELETLDLSDFPILIRIKTYLEKISIAAQKAKTLVQKLFQYSQTGKYELIPIYMEKEVSNAIDLLLLQKPVNIQIRFEKEEGSFPILGEPLWIQQIVDNLVVNSFHSMKFRESGVVTVRLFSDFGDVVLEVEDDGSGIEDAELNKIFTPFYTKKNASEGTGMGLTIIQTIVHKMNGKIQVYSRPGVGTIFQVLIPKWNPDDKLKNFIDTSGSRS